MKKNRYLVIKKCPSCGEPVTIEFRKMPDGYWLVEVDNGSKNES